MATPRATPKKTWTEKLNDNKPHQVKPVPTNFAGMKKGQIMLVPSTKIVDKYIRSIPEGQSMDIMTLRSKLAKRFRAEVTCPVATGFVLRTVAEAAFEAFNAGDGIDEVTPVWRVIDENTPTLKKLSFDPNFILDQRQAEGLAA